MCLNFKVEFKRQNSSASEMNKNEVKKFLREVEEKLQQKLQYQPDIVSLKNKLLSRYGTRYDIYDATRTH